MSSRAGQTPVRRVNIGLDFGTSTTKVIVRIDDAASKPQYLVVAPRGAEASVVFPSCAAVEGDNLLLGAAAEVAATSEKVRSFKMNLPAEAGSRKHAWRGRLRLADGRLTAEDLSTLYIAWVLRDVLGQVREYLSGADLKITLNAAAPLDQMEAEPHLRALFHRIFFRALKIAAVARSPWSLKEARLALDKARSIPVPSDEESPVNVFPETHAAMTSYMLLPGRSKGNYATVDIGAGSTDVAFFWFHATDGQPEMCYYGACSGFVGMDDIDHDLAVARGEHVDRVRKQRENQSIHLGDYTAALSAAMNQIYECYRMGFGRSYARCLGEYEWRHPNGHAKYTLCLVGGGSLCEELVDRLGQVLPLLNMSSIDVDILHVPDNLAVLQPGATVRSICHVAPGEQSLLLLAHGLANRAVDIPRYESGHRHTRVTTLIERPTHEELYAR
jgi:hypothetical protein